MPLFVLTALGVFLLDRGTKLLVMRSLAPAESIPVIPGIFHLTHVRNPGAAFGLFLNQRVFLVAITAAVIVFVILYARRTPAPWTRFGLGLLLGGALGNMVDRITVGSVVDFIDLRIWPVFNAADSAIVVGAILAGICLLLDAESSEAGQSYE